MTKLGLSVPCVCVISNYEYLSVNSQIYYIDMTLFKHTLEVLEVKIRFDKKTLHSSS